MNFFWEKKEFDLYVEELGYKDEVDKSIYCLNLEEGMKAATHLFSMLKLLKKVA